MKKFMIISLCVMLIFTNSALASEVENQNDYEIMLKESIKIGEEFLTDYYSSIMDEKELSRLELVYNKELKEYIELKQLIMKERLINSNTTVESANIDVTYYGHSDSEDGIEVVFNVLQEKKYYGASDLSESMNQVQLTFNSTKDGVVIVDYFELDFFDMNINQIHKSMTKQDVVNEIDEYSDELDFDQELINILEKQLIDEREFYENLQTVSDDSWALINENEINSLNVRTSTTSWNRSAIKTYATNNANKDTPSSGNSSQASYYDFSEITGAYDCTNFASHCMLAGGASENRSTWYYDSLSNRTASWSGVNYFYNFITSNSGAGPQADEIPFNYNCPYQYINWEDGDIVQIQYATYGQPGFGHSTIVTGKHYTSGYPLYSPKITYRTSDTYYCINEPLIIKYPLSSSNNVAYRLIHLTAIGN